MSQCKKYRKELSVASQILSQTQVGYRNQRNPYDSYCGCRSLNEMLCFETVELRNRDIYYTLRDGYGLKLDIRKRPQTLNKQVLYFIATSLQTVPSCVDCVWICAEKIHAAQLYGGENVHLVDFSKTDWMVIADVGRAGLLVAYTRTQAGTVQTAPCMLFKK